MIRPVPSGALRRRAHILPALGLGGLCLALVGCGAAGPTVTTTKSGTSSTTMKEGIDPAQMPPPAAAAPKPYPAGSQEGYAPIVENPFRAARTTPLSTFSAEVNTASYSNVRRFLTGGHLPPRDAVFLAELVNYFPYRYPNPAADAPVSLTLDLAPCPWQPAHHLARVGVRARSFDPGEAPRRNLVFLIDTSGSMAGETRLPLVKQSLELLVRQLRADDRVAIVTYAGDSSVRLLPTPGDRTARILGAIGGLRAGGGTNGAGGIRTAYEVARAARIPGGVNRVVLCTDGDFNVGVTSPGDLDQLVERERESQVFLTVLGYGMGNLKNHTLEALANKGNGHYAYVDSLAEARKVFVEQGGALAVVAKDVKFQVEFNPRRVAAYRLLGYENRLLADADFKNDTVDAGDIGSGLTVTALYEVVPAGVAIDLPGVDPLKYQAAADPAGPADEWLTAKVRYKHPTGGASREIAAVLPADAAGRAVPADFAFAAAVAEWGLLLRNSEYKGTASYAAAMKRAVAASQFDPNGHRREFIDLVRKTMTLAGAGGRD